MKATNATRAWIGSFSVNAANAVLGLASGILAARLLLPEGRGELAEIIFWGSTIAAIGIFGIPSALTISIAKEPSDKHLTAQALVLNFLLAAVSIAAFFALAPLPSLHPAVPLFLLLYLPVNFVGLTLIAFHQGLERFTSYNIARLLPPAVYLIAIFFVWHSGIATPTAFAFSSLLGSLAVIPFLLLSPHAKFQWAIKPARLMELLRLGMTFHLPTLATIALQRVDQLYLILFFDATALGQYTVALTASTIGLTLISGATSAVFLPMLARTTELEDQQRKIRSAISFTFACAIATTGMIALTSPLLIPLLFGPDFRAAVDLTLILCAAQVPLSLVAVGTLALRQLGEWHSTLTAHLVGIATFAVLVLTTSPAIPEHVAIALLVAGVATACYLLWRLATRLHIELWRVLVPPPGSMVAAIVQLRHRGKQTILNK